MGFFITACVLTVIFTLIIFIADFRNKASSRELGEDFWIFAAFIVISLFITLFINVFIDAIDDTYDECYETKIEIVALNDSPALEGHTSFLGQGYFEGELHYYYLQKLSDGNLYMNHVPIDNTTIQIGDSDTGSLITIHKIFKHSYWRLIEREDLSYLIVLPKDTSIKYDFIIDLQ